MTGSQSAECVKLVMSHYLLCTQSQSTSLSTVSKSTSTRRPGRPPKKLQPEGKLSTKLLSDLQEDNQVCENNSINMAAKSASELCCQYIFLYAHIRDTKHSHLLWNYEIQ